MGVLQITHQRTLICQSSLSSTDRTGALTILPTCVSQSQTKPHWKPSEISPDQRGKAEEEDEANQGCKVPLQEKSAVNPQGNRISLTQHLIPVRYKKLFQISA